MSVGVGVGCVPSREVTFATLRGMPDASGSPDEEERRQGGARARAVRLASRPPPPRGRQWPSRSGREAEPTARGDAEVLRLPLGEWRGRRPRRLRLERRAGCCFRRNRGRRGRMRCRSIRRLEPLAASSRTRARRGALARPAALALLGGTATMDATPAARGRRSSCPAPPVTHDVPEAPHLFGPQKRYPPRSRARAEALKLCVFNTSPGSCGGSGRRCVLGASVPGAASCSIRRPRLPLRTCHHREGRRCHNRAWQAGRSRRPPEQLRGSAAGRGRDPASTSRPLRHPNGRDDSAGT